MHTFTPFKNVIIYMTPLRYYFLTLLFIYNVAYSQNTPALTEHQVKNVATLSKIWGFLKYYHPNVANGNYNWDEQFLLVLPKIKDAKTKDECSAVFTDWITSLGIVKPCKSCEKETAKKYLNKNFDLSWTQDRNLFTPQLSQKLKYIEENRFTGKHKYITVNSVGAVAIINEPYYNNYDYPDADKRLMSLAKYWNTVEYFYPYKYLTDTKWNDVLTAMIPKFWNAKNASDYMLAVLQTTIKLDDSHAQTGFETYFTGDTYIPARIKIINNTAIVDKLYNDSLAKIDDIKIGDILLKVDGKTIAEIISEKMQYISASNVSGKLRSLQYYLAYSRTGTPKITFSRNGNVTEKTIKNYPANLVFKTTSAPKWELLQENIGYVNMAQLQDKDVDKLMKEMTATKAIIIDLRTYPNFLPYMLSNYLNADEKAFCNIVVPDVSYPGKFIWKDLKTTGKSNKNYYKGKVVLLVNELTQSRAEFAAMMLQTANNAVTIGSQTAGADGDVTKFYFLGDYKSMISGIGVYYPDGSPTQRTGVKVDVETHPTVKGIQEGKDEVLEKALDYLK